MKFQKLEKCAAPLCENCEAAVKTLSADVKFSLDRHQSDPSKLS